MNQAGCAAERLREGSGKVGCTREGYSRSSRRSGKGLSPLSIARERGSAAERLREGSGKVGCTREGYSRSSRRSGKGLSPLSIARERGSGENARSCCLGSDWGKRWRRESVSCAIRDRKRSECLFKGGLDFSNGRRRESVSCAVSFLCQNGGFDVVRDGDSHTGEARRVN